MQHATELVFCTLCPVCAMQICANTDTTFTKTYTISAGDRNLKITSIDLFGPGQCVVDGEEPTTSEYQGAASSTNQV